MEQKIFNLSPLNNKGRLSISEGVYVTEVEILNNVTQTSEQIVIDKQTLGLNAQLQRLKYDFYYISELPDEPSWTFYEFKYFTLSIGIARLNELLGTCFEEDKDKVFKLLTDYRNKFQQL